MAYPDLLFEYSPKREVERIKYTINRIDWYLANSYTIEHLSLPKTFNYRDLKKITDAEIGIAVKKEFCLDAYVSAKTFIVEHYPAYVSSFDSFLEKTALPVLFEVKVILTVYGVGGSYHLPNIAVCNIAKFYEIGLLRDLLHEIIHLHLEPLIRGHGIDQWRKEALVDLVFESVFPKIYKPNHLPIDIEPIRRIYYDNFPDMEKVSKLISEIIPAQY